MAVKNNSVVKIALQYWIDGKSLIEAQQQAQKEFDKANNKGKAIFTTLLFFTAISLMRLFS